MNLFIYLIDLAFNIAYFIIIAQIAIHWLTIFGVINTENPQAEQVIEALNKITEPVYEKIRKFLPPIGGIDLTPLAVLIGLSVVRSILISLFS